MKPKVDPGINTIIPISNRDFVTGDKEHVIRLWRLLSEEEGPQVIRTESIKGRHKSAVKALAIGGNTLWSSSGCGLLGIDVRSMQTVLDPIIRASSSISQIHYHERFLILEVGMWIPLRVTTDALAHRLGTMRHLSAYTILEQSMQLKTSPCSNSVRLSTSCRRASAKERGSTPLLRMDSPTLLHRWSSYCCGISGRQVTQLKASN